MDFMDSITYKNVKAAKLTYEEACKIAGVPEDRGYVTLNEVCEAINERMGSEMIGSDDIGWVAHKT